MKTASMTKLTLNLFFLLTLPLTGILAEENINYQAAPIFDDPQTTHGHPFEAKMDSSNTIFIVQKNSVTTDHNCNPNEIVYQIGNDQSEYICADSITILQDKVKNYLGLTPSSKVNPPTTPPVNGKAPYENRVHNTYFQIQDGRGVKFNYELNSL